MILTVRLFSQTPISPAISKDYYVQKSKNQKTIAWIILGSGLGIAAAGGIVQLNEETNRNGGWDLDFRGTWIAIAGGGVGLFSIPFFISSAKNARKSMSVLLSNTQIILPQQGYLIQSALPTVSIKIIF